MAAEVLANELRLDLYRIDLASVVSKYIGETEKNLKRVFDAAEDSGAICARCGERYASRMHVEDLKKVLPQMGFNYSMHGPVSNWQELCPACKRKSISLAQMRLKEEANG